MVRIAIGERVAGRLRELREQAGLTQAELAERAGLAPAEISKFENARRTPTLETLDRLADALRVDVAELLRAREPHELAPDVNAVIMKLVGQPTDVIRRVDAVVEALVRAG